MGGAGASGATLLHTWAMLKRIWRAIVGSETPTPEEIQAQVDARQDREDAKDEWRADKARATRQLNG